MRFSGFGDHRGFPAALLVWLAMTLAAAAGCIAPLRQPPPQLAPPDTGETAPAAGAIVDAPEPVPGVIHRVERGQTMWRIARAYDVPLEDIVAANALTDPARIAVGQRLLIPGAAELLDVPPAPGLAVVGPEASFVMPVAGGRILSRFGAPRRTHRHQGLDIGAASGAPVLAAADGRVVYSGETLRGYGKTVIVDHGRGVESLYAHNSRLLVRRGDDVVRGQRIALVGRTGNASAAHCHFEIRRGRVPVDPLLYLERGSP